MSLLAAGFVIATFDVRTAETGIADTMRGGAATLLAPIQRGADLLISPVVSFFDGISNLAGLSDENLRLQEQVRELELRLRETSALERKVEELEAINGLAPPLELASVTARVYSSGPSSFDHVKYILKGVDDGIAIGQAVIDERGLIGRVDAVTASTARVRLLTDPVVSVGVRVQQTNETGVVTGLGITTLRLDMFNATTPVTRGSVVVTDGSRFPPGIVVGYVTESADAEVNFVLQTRVETAARFSKIDYVKVIVGWSPLDAEVELEPILIEPPSFVNPSGEPQ
ncbi:MAG: rod shape-determining protein MreC [Acidobacteria bacterium]|nr:rod shape-determining protein MreC [Acidobacteriota bacterium]